MMKRFLIEVTIIIVLQLTHFGLAEINNTARYWFDAAVVVFAAKGIYLERKDMAKKEGEH